MRRSKSPTRSQSLLNLIREHPQLAWITLVVLTSLVAVLLVISGLPSLPRAVFLFGFLLFVPGWSFIRLLNLDDPVTEWTLAIALSLGLDSLVAMLLLYSGFWSALFGLLVIIAISLGGSLLRVREAKSLPVRPSPEETTQQAATRRAQR